MIHLPSSNQQNNNRISKSEYKVVFVGESTVGKTSIINIANTNEFSDTTPTIGAYFLVNTYMINNCQVKLNLWDTAGQERYRSLTPIYFREMDAGVLIYAIDNIESFNSIPKWYESIMSEQNHKPPLYLVGNKADVIDVNDDDNSGVKDDKNSDISNSVNTNVDNEIINDSDSDHSVPTRVVSYQMGEEMAQKIGAKFFEVSAKTRKDEIKKLIYTIAEDVSSKKEMFTQKIQPDIQLKASEKKGCCD